MTVDIPAGATEDEDGNVSEAATRFSIEADLAVPDTTAPTVTINGPPEPVTGPFTVKVLFSEPVTGFELGDLVTVNGTAAELTGGGAMYGATITPTPDPGEIVVTVDIAAGAAQDSAGNPSAAADQFSIVADLIPVPALPVAGAVALAVLLLVGAVRGGRRADSRPGAAGEAPSRLSDVMHWSSTGSTPTWRTRRRWSHSR